MYNFLRPQNSYRWGRYFPAVPSLPLTDQGTPFRFAWATAMVKTAEDLVDNLEHLSVDETIKTTAELCWSLDGAILIDGNLYKIIDMESTRFSGAASALIRKERTETVIRLKLIRNPIGMR